MLASAVVVAADAGAQPQPAISRLSGLQLLLRFLPFRAGAGAPGAKHQHSAAEAVRHKLLQELQADPLWRFSAIMDGRHRQRSHSLAAWKRLTPQEAEGALLAYVRLAAEAEAAQQQGGGGGSGRWRQQQLSAVDVAAELQALYTLAAVHAAAHDHADASKPWRGQHVRRSLSEGDFLQLFRAYACLGDPAAAAAAAEDGDGDGSSSGSGSRADAHGRTQAAAAAAMQALHAFARLASQDLDGDADGGQQQQGQEQGQQQQQQQQPGAPGQLQASAGRSGASTSSSLIGATPSKQPAGGPSVLHVASSSDGAQPERRTQSGDLQVLLQLAQLTLQAAS